LFRPSLEALEARRLPAGFTGFNLIQGYTPAQIRTAYGFNALTADGSGQTIAIVDAFTDPTIAQDLQIFDQQFNLPDLSSSGVGPHLTIDNLSGGAIDPSGGWNLETALDVEWAHAIAPAANILLVEAASDNLDPVTGEPTDLLHGVDVAAATPGVVTVSMSWGVPEFPGEAALDSHFNYPGITFVAASGDQGAGTSWPAVSPLVVAVGGTSLNLNGDDSYRSERGWGHGKFSFFFGGSGGGISQFEAMPSYQSTVLRGNLRENPDVAYVAYPNTGVAVYDTLNGGWNELGGSSVGSPQWASLIALADQGRAQPLNSLGTLNALYFRLPSGDLRDIVGGNNGFVAARGYDLVTGLGTPVANLLVPDLTAGSSSPTFLQSGGGPAPTHPVSTPGMFDPGTGTWYLRNENSSGAPDAGAFQFGAPGWLPVVGDWDGNGSVTVGVVDPSTATWYLRNENSSGEPDEGSFQYGVPGWIPVVGDWTGSGHSGIGMFDPSTATWYLRNSANPGPPDFVFQYGAPGWIPVTGNWTGTGHTGIGVVDPSTMTWYLRKEVGTGGADAGSFSFGGIGWTPVVGDFNGDGTTTVGVVDPTGAWYLRNTNSAGPSLAPFAYGSGMWIPVSGSWSGTVPQVPIESVRPAVFAGPAGPLLATERGRKSGEPDLTTLDGLFTDRSF
jgi:hypothetical protein